MEKINKMLSVGMLALLAAGFSACNDDETYDFPGDEFNRVYMQDRSTSFKVVQTPISTICNLDFEIAVKCTQRASDNIRATVSVDNSLIDEYNDKNGTEYEALPDGVLVIENATMTIPTGAMASADTLHITTTTDATVLASLKSEKGYLIPLNITSTEGGSAQPSTNVHTSYLTLTITEDNVNHDATESDIKGTLVSDRSGWSATTNGTVYQWYDPIESLFDGDASSYAYISANDELNLDINMGKAYTFDAVTLYYYSYWGGTRGCLSSGTEIFTSNDGTNWKSAGTVESTSSICVFYAPLTTQYVRITLPNTGWGAYTMAGEFNVYETK